MLVFSKCNLFWRRACAVNSLRKTVVANASRKVSKGFWMLRKARKYRRPEDLEDRNYYGVGPYTKVQSLTDSLAARGFPSERPSYTPPTNVSKQLFVTFQSAYGYPLDENEDWRNISLDDSMIKFKFLTKCIEKFSHDIPNSLLCKLKTVKDVENYFSTPIEGTSPYEALIRDRHKLPPNLHIISDPIVFNPDTDTFFKGKTAFPGRKRIVYTKRGDEFEKTLEWPQV